MKKLEHGDTLTVCKLDRLGRSLRDLITMLDDLKQRGVKFRSLTEAIDTATPTGRAMWQMIGVLAEVERSLISERTRAGVKPMYISPGHRISLETALRLTLSVCDGPRIPRPTRDADHYVSELKAARVGSKGNKGDK